MATSTQQFSRDFAAIMKRCRDRQQEVARKVALDLLNSLVMKSPVDTGRFRGNWQVGLGAMNQTTSSAVDPSGSGALSRGGRAIERFKVGGRIFLTNSLPYSQKLEYGHSKQAPGGMVRITVQEYGMFLRRVVETVKARGKA